MNYVALLGWSPRGEREVYSLHELEEIFDTKGLSKSPAIFDIEKLRWFNAEYIRAMSSEDFAHVAEPYIRQAVKNPDIDPAAIAALLQQRLSDLYYYTGEIDGKYGSTTALAVRVFQQRNGLTVDGVAGSGTLDAVYNANALPAPTALPLSLIHI